ncbi:MAG: SiaB family protein kinase [Melioribacteraceae bacterium]|nr:SiaB family protein kinase [Melioribacteraceae bacterium]MCF8266170.1 SiaB family protein kinase [Melioribacteraceae bacterium]
MNKKVSVSEEITGKTKIFYSGPITHNILMEIGDTLREQLDGKFNPMLIKRAFICSNELVQNIGFYSADRITLFDGAEVGKGTIEIEFDSERISINTSNKIKTAKGNALKSRIDTLNELNEDELKAHYKELLKAPKEEESKGGGIGFVEVIRKSKTKLDTDLEEVNAEFSTIKFNVNLVQEKSDG